MFRQHRGGKDPDFDNKEFLRDFVIIDQDVFIFLKGFDSDTFPLQKHSRLWSQIPDEIFFPMISTCHHCTQCHGVVLKIHFFQNTFDHVQDWRLFWSGFFPVMGHFFIGRRWSCPSLCCCQKTAYRDDEKAQDKNSRYFSKQEMNHLVSNKSIFYVSLVAR